MSKPKKPNRQLQHERKLRGWSQQKVAAAIDTDEKRIGVWERGESTPSPFYRQKLCELYGKNAQELGFLDAVVPDDSQGESLHIQPASSIQHHAAQSVDLLSSFSEDVTSDQQSGVWLAFSTQNLTPLFDAGWTPHMILEALHVLLPGVHAMSQISRRAFGHQMLQLGATAFLSGIPLPTGKHVSAEEKMQLCQTLGESIAAGWKLFHTASNTLVLAIGQAELALVQQAHVALYPHDRALFYSSVYNLIGITQHLRGQNEEALQAHTNAHIAALGAGDPLPVAQSLICQADTYRDLGQHTNAIQCIEEGLRTLGHQDQEHMRARAHLLSCWADNAMTMQEFTLAQHKLEEAEPYLVSIGQKEEFDRASWLQLVGKCALMSGDYMTALRYYEEVQAELPAHWIVRQVLVLLPMMVAYACKRDRDASLATAKKAVANLQVLNAPGFNKQFAESVRRGLLDSFPGDKYVQEFLNDTQQHYPLLLMPTGLEV